MRGIEDSHLTKPALDLPLADSLDPYNYTSGRWLLHDKLQRNARYIHFDFDQLRKRVLELCPDAVSITSYEKHEGGYNRVFIFTFDNGKRIVARLPTRVAGPRSLTTNSEVATIKYLQSNTTVPIPKILDWSDDSSNAIGSEYIIMEHVVGVRLHHKWPTMSLKQQLRCIRAIAENIGRIAALTFPAYGSLYFADAPVDSASKVSLDQEFCLGPDCGARYWDCNVDDPRYYSSRKPNHGPWSDLAAYCDGLIDCGFSKIPTVDETLSERPHFHGSVAAHIQVLNCGHDIIHKLSEDPRIKETATPTLCHPDLHRRNIFVSDDDPTVVTDIIDWQSSSINPAFQYADETPDFAPADPEDSSEDQDQPLDKAADARRKAYDVCLQIYAPKLFEPRTTDDDLLRPFRFCHRTWTDGAVALRQVLIELSSRWEELGLPNPCPYFPLASDEMVVHKNDYEDFQDARNLKKRLIASLGVDAAGWVPADEWEATKLAHKEAYDMIVRTITEEQDEDDEEMSVDDLRKIWPFDID